MNDYPIALGSSKKKKGLNEWEVEDALRVLLQAKRIEANKPLLRAAKALAAKQAAERTNLNRRKP